MIARLVERGEERDAGAGAGEGIEDGVRGGGREQDGQNADGFARDELLPAEQQGRAGRRRHGREGERMSEAAMAPDAAAIEPEIERNEVEIGKDRYDRRERRDRTPKPAGCERPSDRRARHGMGKGGQVPMVADALRPLRNAGDFDGKPATVQGRERERGFVRPADRGERSPAIGAAG